MLEATKNGFRLLNPVNFNWKLLTLARIELLSDIKLILQCQFVYYNWVDYEQLKTVKV